MRRLTGVFVALTALGVTIAARTGATFVAEGSNGTLSSKIDALIARHVATDGPGAAVVVLQRGAVVHEKGYGLARVDPETPVTENTVFDLASCSKQFTAVAVMMLADRGKLRLEDEARKYLPELTVHDPARPIRLTDLLHHTSGLPDYLGFVREEVEGNLSRLGNRDILRLVAAKKLDFPTGSKWAYSNTNYCLLSLVVERVSRRSLGRFLRQELFEPLGMKSAFVYEKRTTRSKQLALGYVKVDGKLVVPEYGPLTTGDGAVRMSIADYARWELGLRSGKLVRKQTMQRALVPGKLDTGEKHSYGFGWLVGRDAAGHLLVGHQGEWAGYRSFFLRVPEEDLVVAVLSNSPLTDVGELGNAIALLGLSR